MGVAVFPDHGRTAQALLDAADKALYRSKNAGRNCVTMAG
jgi:GGDEF domain-containing protein